MRDWSEMLSGALPNIRDQVIGGIKQRVLMNSLVPNDIAEHAEATFSLFGDNTKIYKANDVTGFSFVAEETKKVIWVRDQRNIVYLKDNNNNERAYIMLWVENPHTLNVLGTIKFLRRFDYLVFRCHTTYGRVGNSILEYEKNEDFYNEICVYDCGRIIFKRQEPTEDLSTCEQYAQEWLNKRYPLWQNAAEYWS